MYFPQAHGHLSPQEPRAPRRSRFTKLLPWGIAFLAIAFATISIAQASLTFTGTSLSGDGSIVIDGSNTISIGTSTATGIVIGKSGQTTVFPGTVSITGALTGYLVGSNNLSDLAATSTARTNLGVGNLVNSLQLIASNNLSDLPSTSSARTSLGFTGGNKISISATGTVGLTTSSISQFVNDAGYSTSTGGSIATTTNLLKGNGLGGAVAASTSTDYMVPGSITDNQISPCSSTKTASYTVTTADNRCTIIMNSASSTSVIIPSGLGTFALSIAQIGAGTVTVVASGTTINQLSPYSKILTGQYGQAFLTFISTNTFILSGDLQ